MNREKMYTHSYLGCTYSSSARGREGGDMFLSGITQYWYSIEGDIIFHTIPKFIYSLLHHLKWVVDGCKSSKQYKKLIYSVCLHKCFFIKGFTRHCQGYILYTFNISFIHCVIINWLITQTQIIQYCEWFVFGWRLHSVKIAFAN